MRQAYPCQLAQAYLLYPARSSICLLEAGSVSSGLEEDLADRIWGLDVSERVFFRVAFDKAAGSVHTHGREAGGGGVCGGDYSSLSSRCKGELAHCGIWVDSLGVHFE